MKRSSRIIIVLGIILAAAAFGGVLLLSSNVSSQATPPPPTTTTVVVAAADIPLGTTVSPTLLGTKDIKVTDAPPDGYSDPAGLTGRVLRRDVRAGEILRSADFASGSTARGDDVLRALEPGLRAMAIRVDQVTGVGTLIQPGDRVDVVIALKVTSLLPGKEPGDPPIEMPGGAQLTVKNVVQNVQVLATLAGLPGGQASQPAPSSAPEGSAAEAAPSSGIGLTGQEEIVIVAVTPEQAEVIKFAQVKEADQPELTMSLVLRSPADRQAPPDQTAGVTLKTLVDKYGVLPPVPLTAQPVK